MSQQQRQILRETAQFREEADLRRRRPIGIEGPLPVPPGPIGGIEVAMLVFTNGSSPAGFSVEGLLAHFGVVPDPNNRLPVYGAGKMRKLTVTVPPGGNTLDGPCDVEILKNGAATGHKLSIGAGAVGDFGPVAGEVAFAAKDKFSFNINATGAGAGTIGFVEGSAEFVPD